MTITEQLINKAKQSSCRYKISCIGLNKKGEVIGSSTNRPRFNHHGGGLHAEANLIRRYGNRLKTIIICRVGNKGNILPIEPCDRCLELASKLDIRILSIKDTEI